MATSVPDRSENEKQRKIWSKIAWSSVLGELNESLQKKMFSHRSNPVAIVLLTLVSVELPLYIVVTLSQNATLWSQS